VIWNVRGISNKINMIFEKLKKKYGITVDTETESRPGTHGVADCIFMHYGK
jgi:hypothetical protein